MRDFLTDTAIRLHKDDEFSADETIREGQVEVSRIEPAVRISTRQVDLSEYVGISDESLELVVVVEDGLFKSSEILYRSQLVGLNERCIHLPQAQCRKSATWSSETRIHVAVILSDDLASDPGTANRAGSWLAKKTFRITREMSLARFPIDSVDKDWFVERRLPADTTYFIDIIDTDFSGPEAELKDLMRIKVNKSLVEALARDENSLANRAIIRAIYTDIVTSILSVGFSNDAEDPHPESVLYAAVTRIAQRTSIPSERLIGWAKSAAISELRAAVQAEIGLTRTLVSAARRRAV